MVKAQVCRNSRAEVIANDFLPCQHMTRNHPDDADSARPVVSAFVSVFTRKAQLATEAMEPVAHQMEELRTKPEDASELSGEEND